MSSLGCVQNRRNYLTGYISLQRYCLPVRFLVPVREFFFGVAMRLRPVYLHDIRSGDTSEPRAALRRKPEYEALDVACAVRIAGTRRVHKRLSGTCISVFFSLRRDDVGTFRAVRYDNDRRMLQDIGFAPAGLLLDEGIFVIATEKRDGICCAGSYRYLKLRWR
jgi:hypothetical protein